MAEKSGGPAVDREAPMIPAHQDTGQLSWFQPSVQGDVPNRRSGHSLTACGSNVWLFGGLDHSLPPGPTSDMYVLQMGSDTQGTTMEWVRPKTSGLPPLARWNHSATLYDKNKVLIFGGFHSSTNRFNDVHVFDVITLSWYQPVESPCDFTPRGNHMPAKVAHPGVPTPRGGHSAALHSDRYLWVFGGYGGFGYARRDFNDMYVLDIKDGWTWSKVAAKGTPPEPRSGHTGVLVKDDLLVFGGHNAATKFNDLCVFDTLDRSWTEVKGTGRWGPMRWNHAAVAVAAIPNWKVFLFGGQSAPEEDEDAGRGGGKSKFLKQKQLYLNDVAVLDTGRYAWAHPECAGTAPSGRSSSEFAFDERGNRLIVFGGWANRWLDDIHILDIGSVVGPPYAILGIDPPCGPITGKVEVRIEGMEFADNAPRVRFTNTAKKGAFTEVPATFVTDRELVCEAPNFEPFGPGTVDVRVALGTDSYTLTFQKYTFFLVTDATKSFAFGPGVLEGSPTGVPSCFIIQARDTDGRNRSNGGDEFIVTVTCVEDPDGRQPKVQDIDIEDNGNGSYMVKFKPVEQGKHTIAVEFGGTYEGVAGHIAGSPYTATFEHGVPRDRAQMEGPLVKDAVRRGLGQYGRFIKKTELGLKTKLSEDDVSPLLTVIENLVALGKQTASMELGFEVAKETMAYLGTEHGVNMTAQESQLSDAMGKWAELKTKAPKVKQQIGPLVTKFSGLTQAEAMEYQNTITEYLKAFKGEAFWQFATGVEGARRGLDDADRAQQAQRKVCDDLLHRCAMLEVADAMGPALDAMKEVDALIGRLRTLWDTAGACLTYFEEARGMLWSDIDADSMEEEAKDLLKKTKSTHRSLKQSNAYKGVEQEVKDFLSTCPLLVQLHHRSMRPRHWTMLQDITGIAFTPPHEDPHLLLGGLLSLGLHKHGPAVEEITDQAQKEEKMEVGLETLEQTWSGVLWETEEYKGTGGGGTGGGEGAGEGDEEGKEGGAGGSTVLLLRLGEEDFEQLEADQLIVQGMLGSRFLATFEAKVTGWATALRNISDVVSLLAEIQRTWSYLEPLFIGSEEVKRELPHDAKRFAKIDVAVKEILRKAGKTGNVNRACNADGLLARLEAQSDGLEVCKKSLADFLDGKRQQFPRFYFVSEADLLDLLSNGSNPRRIMRHITKVFLATRRLELTGGAEGSGTRPTVTEWVSDVGVEKTVIQPSPVALEGRVEVYLQVLLDAMIETLRVVLTASVARYPTEERTAWLLHLGGDDEPLDAAQVAIAVAAVNYVMDVEAAFDQLEAGDSEALKEYRAKHIKQLEDLIKLTVTALSKRDRRRVMTMITMDAHGRDIVTDFVRKGVSSKREFLWMAQLKPRYEQASEGVKIDICDASFMYAYEYLGNGARLVITPLTDRIYVTATQALHLKMGCAPAGPAGTGKTETTKDLASALGTVCYVVNCAPEMDYKSMGNIFKGLAAAGAWGCFDEFNRLVPEVLSVCSVQFKAVCDGCKAGAPTVTIEGDTVRCDPRCGAFITMNPGYLGRSELPEGLKALFRPITVMVPDLVLICENMLMAEGFVGARVLARKFYGLYSLLKELLSKQDHYDWGLRAVKSVLVVAGQFKRAEPDLQEDDILMRALRDFNTPKIVKVDEPVFFGLLGDLFPGIDPPRAVDAALEDAVKGSCAKLGLWPDEDFRLKVVQLEELLDIRHCVFVMGPPGAGKSKCWQTLADSKSARGLKTKIKDLNPKAVSPKELYGYINLATREWRDGVLSVIMRDLGEETTNVPESGNNKWIVLDGDLDANWIESMNSVMDDNRMLTLASNERIPLKPHMRMIFEIRDLKYATPATVSRAGILYISTDKGTQWRSMIASWVQQIDPALVHGEAGQQALGELFDQYVGPTLKWLQRNVAGLVPIEDISMVNTLLNFLTGTLQQRADLMAGGGAGGGGGGGGGTPAAATPAAAGESKGGDAGDANAADIRKWLEPLFVYCGIWAFGSTLSVKDGEDHRKAFNDYWRSTHNKGPAKLPSRETIFDYYLDIQPDGGAKFDGWKNSSYFFSVPFDSETMNMGNVTVPTTETASVTYWTDMLVSSAQPVMLVGYAGCGKTQQIAGAINRLDARAKTCTTINMNFYTDAELLQRTLEGVLEKKTGTNYGPVGQTSMIYFLDDLNLPEVDAYNTQSAIALVRQHLDYAHWYDRAKLSLKNIMNCQYLACMNHTVGSFTVNPRLQRHFATFAVGLPTPTSLLQIYTTFLEGHLRDFDAAVLNLVPNLLKGSLALHNSVMSTFRKTAKNFHYEFNLRHISNLFEGLLNSRKSAFKGEAQKMVALWLHEAERVYGDRLVNTVDLGKFKALAAQTAKKHFPAIQMGRFFAAENPDPLVFCHYADTIDEMLYDQVTDMEHLTETSTNALSEYNEVNATMDLVLFEDAVKHVARISRIILNPAGHALLVGVGGMGKRSLCRLASFICGYTVKMIQISSSYGLGDLKADLQDMYKKAGTKGDGLVFLFTDQQITNPRFLVFMNDLLASGNIPDLFPVEDIDDIVNLVTAKVKAAGLTADRTTCWDFFIREVRRNLHVCLCFSPVSDDFRVRCTRFPALVNCTVIDWFQPWPKEALSKVGIQFLGGVDLGDEQCMTAVQNFMPFSFESVNRVSQAFREKERREAYTTPKSYLELLQLYTKLLADKRKSSAQAIDRLSNGLSKLRETASTVGVLEEEVKVALEAAEVKKAKAEEIAEVVGKEKAIVDEETSKANDEAAKCDVIQKEVTGIQASAQADLDAAEPLVAKAMAALDTLNKKDLGECKTMSTPPKGVDDIFGAVMVLLAGVDPNIEVNKQGKVKNKGWDAAKKQMMSNVVGFLENLKNFKAVVDRFEVPSINWKEVRPFLELEHFDFDIISKKNKAAGGLVSWVINIVIYYDTIVGVEPKRQALKQANQRLEAATVTLNEVNAKVAELQAKLNKLTVEFDAATTEKQKAIDEVARMQLKLSLAQRLIMALASENDRWAINIDKMAASRNLLVGDVLLASAFISYVGPFTKPYRNELVNTHWIPFFAVGRPAAPGVAGGRTPPPGAAAAAAAPGADEGDVADTGDGDDGADEASAAAVLVTSTSIIPTTEPSNPVSTLTTEAEVARWNSQGLPSDVVSVENGAVVANSARWPLMIDPQLQGIAWVREKEADRGLAIVRLGQKDLMNKLEYAMENGTSLLIENMGESIDAALNPVIARQTVKKGSRLYVILGDKEVELNPEFRFFLHTKLSNPHYPPEVQAETALVNFTVTEPGLEDQLLALVMRKERNDLAEQRAGLIEQDNEFKIKMVELEDQILHKLATAEGEITEDVELIEGLEDAKRISNEIAEKMAEAAKTTETIVTTSEKYRSVATRGALLFFVMKELFRVHTYYMYSLNSFVVVFLRGIDLVSQHKGGDGAGGGAGGAPQRKVSNLLSRFKKAARKVVAAARFNWNKDMLAPARRTTGADIGAAVADLVAKGKMDLSDDDIVDRCEVLRKSILSVVFNYMRRGLFEQDKLMAASLLALRIQSRMGTISETEVDALVVASPHPEPGGMGGLAEWMTEAIWTKVKGLESLGGAFEKFGDDMQTDSDDWVTWFDLETPEEAHLPGNYRELGPFQRLLVLRVLRPDRLPSALSAYVAKSLGDEFINQSPFDMRATFEESSPSTPIFFTLFPGVDPTTWVEGYGETVGMTAELGKFLNISMGQGQDGPAEAAIERFAKEGGWLMLQNVHLMQAWLPRLERALESCSETAHPDFRCFISGEPPAFSYQKYIPESLMQSCIKVMNEAPADLKSNLRRAWSNFSDERIQGSKKPVEFKACLFTLCFFHAVVLGRRKFGQQGWSRKYSFNTGDLLICANVCESYINNNDTVPWDDLRYIFGEIMYGGHITDPWDRRTNSTYLAVLLEPSIFRDGDLVPCSAARGELKNKKGEPIPALFPSPNPKQAGFTDYAEHIEEGMPAEAPGLFGLHPNAEIGYLSTFTESICQTILVLSGGGGGGGGGDSGGGGGGVKSTVGNLLRRLPEKFKLLLLNDKAEPLLATTEAPYVLVALQEFGRMNTLLSYMEKTLTDLEKGLNGQLNMSASMDDLLTALTIFQVPGRNPFHKCSWESLAWWSKKSLLPWFNDMLARVAQLTMWSENLSLPLSLWYPGLFNPMSFNTAIMQVTARLNKQPLDSMTTETHVTTMMRPEQVQGFPKDGRFIHGLFMEGARWLHGDDCDVDPHDVNGTPCQGHIIISRLKELLPVMPIIYLKAVVVDPSWEAASVGYLRHKRDIYECPVYQTTFRGPTYVFLATLDTPSDKHVNKEKWVLAGVALMLQTDD